MSRISAKISNGRSSLILTDSFIGDDREAINIYIPTTLKKDFLIRFEFEAGEVVIPTHSLRENTEGITLNVRLGSTSGAFVATKNKVPLKIASTEYQILFAVTRIAANSVRVEVSVYE